MNFKNRLEKARVNNDKKKIVSKGVLSQLKEKFLAEKRNEVSKVGQKIVNRKIRNALYVIGFDKVTFDKGVITYIRFIGSGKYPDIESAKLAAVKNKITIPENIEVDIS